jgi:hypothetical protein
MFGTDQILPSGILSRSAQATICLNSSGHIIHTISQISLPYSPNEREALATQLAISLANSLHLNRFILERDSELMIQVLQNPNCIRDWRISYLILDLLDSIPSASFWEARKINRSTNFCVHSEARWAAARSHYGSIPSSSLSFLLSSLSSGDPPFACF